MTLSLKRLKDRAVDPRVLEFRAWRDCIGMKQSVAAERLGYKPTYLANVELGVKAPSRAMVVRMRELIDGWGK